METSELWLESSTQVAKSPSRQVAITLPAKGPARGLGGDLPGGDACFGPPRAINIPNGLTAETSAQLPWLGKLSHRWMVVFYNQHSDQSTFLIFWASFSCNSIRVTRILASFVGKFASYCPFFWPYSLGY